MDGGIPDGRTGPMTHRILSCIKRENTSTRAQPYPVFCVTVGIVAMLRRPAIRTLAGRRCRPRAVVCRPQVTIGTRPVQRRTANILHSGQQLQLLPSRCRCCRSAVPRVKFLWCRRFFSVTRRLEAENGDGPPVTEHEGLCAVRLRSHCCHDAPERSWRVEGQRAAHQQRRSPMTGHGSPNVAS